MSKYTPGPWLRDGRTIYALNSTPENRFYVHVQGGFIAWNVRTPDDELEANARLIAAAPSLLEALEEIVDYRGGADNALEDEYVMERVFAAIAAAKGDA